MGDNKIIKWSKRETKIYNFENVAIITSKKYKETLESYKKSLRTLGYHLYDDLLCATNYEIPQNRTRYFLVAKLDNKKFSFPQKIKSNVKLYNFLEENVADS